MLSNPKQRIAPLTPPYDDETAAALAEMRSEIALFRLFARRPLRAHGTHGWGRYYYSKDLALTIRQRELVIDRTTARLGASYEWGIHIGLFAGKAGLTEEQVTSVTYGSPSDDCWEDNDRAVIAAVDALLDTADIDDATWVNLVAAVGEEGAIDLLLLCGWYHSIAFVVRAIRLDPEPGMPTLQAQAHDGSDALPDVRPPDVPGNRSDNPLSRGD